MAERRHLPPCAIHYHDDLIELRRPWYVDLSMLPPPLPVLRGRVGWGSWITLWAPVKCPHPDPPPEYRERGRNAPSSPGVIR